MKFTDKEIIEAIKSGEDRKALHHMYKTYFPEIKKYIMKNSGDNDVAFDVFQDGMVIFYKYVRQDKFNLQHEIGAFLFTICRNIWYNKLKKDKRMVNIPDYADSESHHDTGIMDQLISREREKLITHLLNELGQKCKELLQFSVFHKLRNSEICKKMGFSTENAVKTQKYKCMQKLISLVQNQPGLKNALRES